MNEDLDLLSLEESFIPEEPQSIIAMLHRKNNIMWDALDKIFNINDASMSFSPHQIAKRALELVSSL